MRLHKGAGGFVTAGSRPMLSTADEWGRGPSRYRRGGGFVTAGNRPMLSRTDEWGRGPPATGEGAAL